MRFDLPCEVIRDLLPSYIDKLTSDNVKESVEYHLKNCSECKKKYDYLKSTYNIICLDENKEDKQLMKTAKRKINKKIAAIALIVAIIVASITITGAVFATKDEHYYWSMVPSDCEYALIDGQKLKSRTETVDYGDGIKFDVTFICGVAENKSGKTGDDYQVVLYDKNGNEHKEIL